MLPSSVTVCSVNSQYSHFMPLTAYKLQIPLYEYYSHTESYYIVCGLAKYGYLCSFACEKRLIIFRCSKQPVEWDADITTKPDVKTLLYKM